MAKILVIDDSSLSRRLMRRILEDAGHEVIEANEGYSALEIYTLEKPGLVMLDLTMPGITGFEVLKQIKSINPDTRVIVASADVQSLTRAQVFEVGADGFVNKPFITEEVLDLVKKLV